MKHFGTGRSGLAILGLKETDKCKFTGRPFQHFPLFWKGVPPRERDHVLTAALFGWSEPVVAEQTAERGRQFLELCEKKGIRTIITIGTLPLRTISPVHGKSTKLIGSTILHGGLTIIPLETHHSGFRVFRSFAWTEAQVRFVKRGLAIAQGRGRYFNFPRIVTGDTPEAEAALRQILEEGLPVGLDLETTGHDFHTDKITAFGLANKNVAVSIPWEAYVSRLYGPQAGLLADRTRTLVTEILENDRITKLVHNGMFDLSVLASKDIHIAGPVEDTLLAHKIVHPDLFHNLQFCMSYEFALHPWKTVFEQIQTKEKTKIKARIRRLLKELRKAESEGKREEVVRLREAVKRPWENIEPQALMTYNAQDAAAECPLWERLSTGLSTTHRGWENYNRLKELAKFAADMQYRGVAIDQDAAEEHRQAAVLRIAELEEQWNNLAPEIDPASSKALNQLFFEELKAPVHARTKKGKEQMSSAVLLEYAGDKSNPRLAEIAFTLFEYRKIKKSYDAFLKPLSASRVHAKPQVAGTRGTRFSYSEPNLQQWSKEKTIIRPGTKEEVSLAPNLRNLVVPDSGLILGEHDYNALEARLVAYAANIPLWLEWLSDEDIDMHIEHVKLMFGRTVKKSDPLRQIVKTLTYARFYNRRKSVGQVLKSLKPSMPDLTEHRLIEIFDRFDKARPEVLAWQEQVELFVRENGYVELTLSGIRQYHDPKFPDINAALSFGIQSTGGDIINSAALRIAPRLVPHDARILINVHDALVWQAPPKKVKEVAQIVTEEMEKPVDLWQHKSVVIPTECKVGKNWRDLVKLEK